MNIFSPDGRLAAVLNRIGDLIILNVLTILCCIPVITAGAALTALYSVTLKMVKNEEGKIVTEYFRAFRGNFKQATMLWMISAAALLAVVLDFHVLRQQNSTIWTVYKGVLLIVLVLLGTFICYLFPVLARFVNTTKNTAKNAMLFSVIHPFQSVLMLVTVLIPVVLPFISLRVLFLEALLGIAGPAFLTSIYYRHVFQSFEVPEAA